MTIAWVKRGRKIVRKLRRSLTRVRTGGGPLYAAGRPLRRARLLRALAAETGPEDVTVVLSIRNRNDHRLPNTLRLLRAQDWPRALVHIAVVDYGSERAQVPWLREQCERVDASYLRVESPGPWNRSHCQNIVIARARTRYILSTDIDMLFAPDYLRRGIELLRAQPLGVVLARSLLDLPESWTSLFANHAQITAEDLPGLRALCEARRDDGVDHLNCGTNLARTALYQAIRGYDEAYLGWGAEDDDLIKRLRSFGADVLFTDSHYMHQWHPRLRGAGDPVALERIERNRRRLYRMHSAVRNPSGWGEL